MAEHEGEMVEYTERKEYRGYRAEVERISIADLDSFTSHD